MRPIVIKLIQEIDRKKWLFPKGLNKVLNIGEIKLQVDLLDYGGAHYNSRKSFEESESRLYPLIQKDYNPKYVIDVGANYGFISVIAFKQFPSAKIIAIEPSDKLLPYIQENFKLNHVTGVEVLNSICGETDKDEHSFAINPWSSQDNRVQAPDASWAVTKVNMVSIDAILRDCPADSPVFIKTDTQGYEEMVIKGGSHFLTTNTNWILKTEFSPLGLSLQGTDAKVFLTSLVTQFDVAELPATITYFTKSTNDLFLNKVKLENIDEFLTHIKKLDADGKGWVDLLLRPKTNN